MLFQMSPDGAREEGVEANSVDYVMPCCPDFEALGPSGPGSIRGFQNSGRVSLRSAEVAITTNQNDETVLGPERRHEMETSESSRKGKGIDCDEKWQG
jgi:hypothetical protein